MTLCNRAAVASECEASSRRSIPLVKRDVYSRSGRNETFTLRERTATRLSAHPTFHTRRNRSNWFHLSFFFFFLCRYRIKMRRSFFSPVFLSAPPSVKLGIFPSAFVLAIATVDAIHRVTGVIFPSRVSSRSARNNTSRYPSSFAFISRKSWKKRGEAARRLIH